MGFINQMLKQYCPQGVEFRKLSEVFTRYKGTSITASKMHEISKENGTIRVFAGGKTVIDTDIDSLPNGNIIDFPAVLVQSRGIIDVIYYDKPFTFKNEMWAYSNKNKIKTKFLYYYLKHNIKHFRKLASSMGALPQIGIQVTDNYLIPVPPIEIQTEIVRILDVFNDLEAELEARKKQYEFYRDQLLSFAPPPPKRNIE